MKSQSKLAPDRVILFETGLIIALLLVNWFLHLHYVPSVYYEKAEVIPMDTAFILYEEVKKEEKKTEKKQEVKQLVEFKPERRIRLVDKDLFKMDDRKFLEKLLPQGSLIKMPSIPGSPTGAFLVDSFTEQMPSFPGGREALIDFVTDNLKISMVMRDFGADIHLRLSFVVRTDGRLEQIKVLYCSQPGLGAEQAAKDVIRIMPAWNPGYSNGVARNVYQIIPLVIRF